MLLFVRREAHDDHFSEELEVLGAILVFDFEGVAQRNGVEFLFK